MQRTVTFAIALWLGLVSASCTRGPSEPKKPMGALPSAVTSAEPQWLPLRVLAGASVAPDERETHLFDVRRITRDFAVEQAVWAPDLSFIAILGKRANEPRAAVFKLPLSKSFREVVPEKVSRDDEAPTSVAVSRAAGGELRILYAAGGSVIERRPDGSQSRIDTGPYAPIELAVDPSSNNLYLIAKHEGGVGLVRAAADGSAPQLLVQDQLEPAPPALSPDRAYVAVSSAGSGKSNEPGLLITSTLGGQQRRIAQASGFASRSSSFHPAGRWLAFASERDRKEGELYIVEWASDGRVERLTFSQGAAPTFSPDGRSLAFTSSRAKGPSSDLYVARFLEDP